MAGLILATRHKNGEKRHLNRAVHWQRKTNRAPRPRAQAAGSAANKYRYLDRCNTGHPDGGGARRVEWNR